MNTTKMPGFTAELALGRTAKSYHGRCNGSLDGAAGHGPIRAAQADGPEPIDFYLCVIGCVSQGNTLDLCIGSICAVFL
jgi:hypothetical protein